MNLQIKKMEPKKDKFKSLKNKFNEKITENSSNQPPVTSTASTTIKGDQGNFISL